jgi:hypothetical protein
MLELWEHYLSDQRFYVGAEDQKTHKITGYVPSKFLARNGTYVVDPVPGASQLANVYSDSSGGNQTDGKIANPNNYVIVPTNYSEQQAKESSAQLAAAQRFGGFNTTLPLMIYAFWPGGSEELQRNPRWGIPPNSFVRAYKSAASDHFGYVTAAAGLPRALAEFGGGVHNLFSKAFEDPDVDTSGKAGLSKVNEANIAQGYAAGLAARSAPSPSNAITPSSPTSGNVDDSSTSAETPNQDSSVRYLGSRLVPY